MVRNITNTYSPSFHFIEPLRISGTKEILLPNKDLKYSVDFPDIKDLITEHQIKETKIKSIRFPHWSIVETVSITEENLILKYEDSYYYLPIKDPTNVFDKFCTSLKIPTTFCRRNDNELNSINFSHYMDKEFMLQHQNLKVIEGLIHNQLETVSTAKGKDIKAYQLLSFVSIHTNTPKQILRSPLPEPIKFSTILNNLNLLFESVLPNYRLKTGSSMEGYFGQNKGKHFVRLLMAPRKEEASFSEFTLNEIPYCYCITVEVDYLNCDSHIRINFGLYNKLSHTVISCSWTDLESKNFKEYFLQHRFQNRKVSLKEQRAASQDFKNLSGGKALKLKVSDLQISTIRNLKPFNGYLAILSFMNQNQSIYKKRIEQLQQPFVTEFDYDKFIEVLQLEARRLRFKCRELITYTTYEWVAGIMTNQQYLKSPFDFAMYLGTITQSFNSNIVTDTESKSMQLAQTLYQRFVDIEQTVITGQFTKIKGLLEF